MTIRWLTAVLDFSAGAYQRGVEYWSKATATEVSRPSGPEADSRILVPASGDATLRVQRKVDEPSGVRLDVHVDNVAESAHRAVELGATEVADGDHVVMTSPAGFTFAVARYDGQSERPPLVTLDGGSPYAADQVCIDVPTAAMGTEVRFWAALTGWEARVGALDEFSYLVRPAHVPLRLLFQRLGPDDPGRSARAHLDLACADAGETVAVQHEQLGARRHHGGRYWITLTDPAGLPYCLTQRHPITGSL